MPESQHLEYKRELTESEFFEGFSMPRNKELMRVFRDLDMVEHLGSGVPRILKAYPKSCFRFTDNFIRMSFPAAEPISTEEIATTQKTTQKTKSTTQRILAVLIQTPTASRRQIAESLGDITADGVKYQLDKLKKEGQIQRSGPDKGGHWKVLKP